MSDPVAPFEDLSRFILEKKQIRADNTLRHTVFMPNRNGETSVFRISGISENQIWEIAVQVSRIRNKELFGRADIPVLDVLSKKLQLIINEPPKRHANIIGWPDDPSTKLSIAQELAAEATFRKVFE
ncbi:MAG: hypothetical protein WCO26_01520 [Deltaproteobacteria bacterium]